MVEGGIFTILDNCLQKISIYSIKNELNVIALVRDKTKFNYPNIEFIDFSKAKKSWFSRLYFEYFYFKNISKKIKPDIWLSLHDTSPNVVAKKRFVYCHHATIFYKTTFADWKFDYKIGVFSILYKFIFRINIKKNKAVFVQQDWIKKEFESLFEIDNVVTCPPEFIANPKTKAIDLEEFKTHFFYPLLPRSYKNIECIGDAVGLLSEDIKSKIKIHLTISKGDSKYADFIVDQYQFPEMNYVGRISLEEVFGYYEKMDCLLFPSKLESSGLPLTEAKAYGKPIFAANLAHARETIGQYDKVSFFDVDKPQKLAQLITEFVEETIQYQGNKPTFDEESQLKDWDSIFDYILKD